MIPLWKQGPDVIPIPVVFSPLGPKVAPNLSPRFSLDNFQIPRFQPPIYFGDTPENFDYPKWALKERPFIYLVYIIV